MDETSPKTGWQNLRVRKGYSVTVLFLFKELLDILMNIIKRNIQ